MHGAIFDHLSASGPLLAQLLERPSISVHVGLRDFIIEYHVYTGLISMISIDSTIRAKPLIEPALIVEARRLATSGYVGHLCGCWLSLLLLIPDIHALGGRALATTSDPSFPGFDDFVAFSSIQSQILAFCPSITVGDEVALCASIYQQAMHLYLLTALDRYKSENPGGLFWQLIENSVEQSFVFLRRLTPTARINTSLCWAIGVIGCCVRAEAQREELRERLEIMFQTIGLGNIRATAKLLELVWQRPLSEQSPWFIHKVMQENQMWISFA